MGKELGGTQVTFVITSCCLGNVRLWGGAKARGLGGLLDMLCISTAPTLKLKCDTQRHLGVPKKGGDYKRMPGASTHTAKLVLDTTYNFSINVTVVPFALVTQEGWLCFQGCFCTEPFGNFPSGPVYPPHKHVIHCRITLCFPTQTIFELCYPRYSDWLMTCVPCKDHIHL